MSFLKKEPKRFCFIHIPKNAGTSIYPTFGKKVKTNIKHHDLFQCREMWGDDLGFTFVIVRNPWDRMVSYYHFMRRSDKNPDKKNMSFEDFIMGDDWMRVAKQQHEYFDEVDMILRYENLKEDIDKLCKIIGIPKVDLKHKNKSAHNDYRTYYNEKTKAEVQRRCKVDIQKFGYTFEG